MHELDLETGGYGASTEAEGRAYAEDISAGGALAATGLLAAALGALAGCTVQPRTYPRPGDDTTIDAFDPAQVPALKEALADKKLALALITTYDHNGATKGMEEMFSADLADAPGYVLRTGRPEDIGSLLNHIRDYAAVKRIDALILAYHGDRTSMAVNGYESLGVHDVGELFKGYEDCFAPDARIIIYSCSVGKGSGNLTEAISAALRRDAVGPTGALIPETDLPPASRIGELGLDASGRLGYDEGHYALFGHLHFKGSTYTNAVAPTSYVGVGDNALASGGRGSEALFLHVDADEAAGAGGR